MARKSLDDILDGNEPELETVEAQPEQQPEPEPQPRDEQGKFAGKGVNTESEVPSDPLPPEDYKAVKNERERRQRAETEREDLAKQLEALRNEIRQQQQPKEPPAPPPDMFGEPENWQQHFGGQLVSTAVQQAAYQSRLQMSEMLMAEQHEDFAAVKDQLVDFVGKNHAVNQAVAESQHPWRTAYQAFKNQQTMQELGATDIATLKQKLREELLAELQAQAPVQVPPSLSTKRSVGSRSGPAWTGPTPLGDLIGN